MNETQNNGAPDLAQIKSLVADDLAALNTFIHDHLDSNLAPIDELNRYIINSGGKRLRSLIVLLIARTLANYNKNHVPLAAIIEFIHTATLLHDDVVDDADLRRGQKTIKHLQGNSLSILVGDFLYSRAFQLITELGIAELTKILANTTNIIAEGEVQQLLNCRHTNITEAIYLEVIYRKTAVLFEAAAKSSALIAASDKATLQKFSDFGRNIGFAFQLLDDALDYSGLPVTGKKVGGDLAEGKATAPFIYALKHCSNTEADMLKQALSNCQVTRFEDVRDVIKSSGGLEHTYRCAEKYAAEAHAALASLPMSDYKQALEQLTAFIVTRNH